MRSRGDIEAATGLYNRLLTMNLTDNQGTRHRLAELDAVRVVVAPGM